MQYNEARQKLTPKGLRIKHQEELDKLKETDMRAYIQKIREICEVVSYPGGTTALYDEIGDTYYNTCGQRLKRPEDYHADNDGRYY